MVGTLFRLTGRSRYIERSNKEIALIQTASSVGGVIAMGIGFTLPMLYFLDPTQFNDWLATPAYFCAIIASACLTAGGLGICLARSYAHKLIEQEKLAFPVSGLIYKTITSQSQTKQAKSMFTGFFSAVTLTVLRDGVLWFPGIIKRTWYVVPSMFGKDLAFSIWPMVWSMGFIAGMGIVFRLLIGFLSRYFVLYPLNYHSQYLPFAAFAPLQDCRFAMAFCSGFVLTGIVFAVLWYPASIWQAAKTYSE